MNVLLLNGPNLNLLGEHEPSIYGTTTLVQIEQLVAARAVELGCAVRAFQSNHEGALIDRLHEARRWAAGCIFNPGALTHTSYALRDAIAAVPQVRVVEVHLSDLNKREAWRQVSVIAEVVAHRIMGKGVVGYLEALEWLTSADQAARS
jgi:3-dehydroquinate dehydratase type II